MLALKTAVGAWLMPLPFCLILICCGLLLRLAGRRRFGAALITVGAIVVLAAATRPIADAILRPLEARYNAVADAATLTPAPRYVVVLGSGYQLREGWPVTAELDDTGVVRLAEGIRLLRQLQGAQLVVSGGPVSGEAPVAQGYARAAEALGVAPPSILLVDTPRDTAEEVAAIHQRVGDAPVLLVTSAAHMPRAMAYARRAGLRAVAAPTGNLVDPKPHPGAWIARPSGAALRKTETALHEYLGLLLLKFETP